MASVNKVILVGNLGKDPETRFMPNGDQVTNVTIATSETWKDKSTGETIEDTQWHRITFYDRLAEIAGEYVKKGRPIYVEGRLKYGKYTDQSGVEKNTCDIVATELQLLGGREGGDSGQQGNGNASGNPRSNGDGYQRQSPPAQARQQAPAPRQAPPPRQAPAAAPASGFDPMDDDDIPFLDTSMHYDMTTSKARKMARYDY